MSWPGRPDPLPTSGAATVEQRTAWRIIAGSQAIVLARPLRVHVAEGQPLLHHQGGYAAVRPLPQQRGQRDG